MILVVIIGAAGKTCGGCIETLLLGGVGLGLGVACFAVLGVLGQRASTPERVWGGLADDSTVAGHSPVGQGFVFAAFCYFAALVRHKGSRYISFYLVRLLLCLHG